jgi:hypothetical protein
MSEGRIRIRAGEALPVEVRNGDMKLVASGLSDALHSVEPGEYFVAATLPGDETLLEQVVVESGGEADVDFTAALERARPPLVHSAGLLHDFLVPAELPWKLRFVTLDDWRAIEAHDIEFEMESTDGSGTATLIVHNRDTRVVFAVVGAPHSVPVHVALPAVGFMDSQDCRLVVTTNKRGPVVRAIPVSEATESPSRYFASGDLASAAKYITPEFAEELLAGKMMDPLAAAVGGYVLLAYGDLDRMHDWPGNLADWFGWLPDGTAIEGERLARLGLHSEALDRFLELGERGLPIFTDGLSLAVSRLRHYAGSGRKRIHTKQPAAGALAQRLEAWLVHADFGALTVTMRAADLSDPEKSQLPADLEQPGWRSVQEV